MNEENKTVEGEFTMSVPLCGMTAVGSAERAPLNLKPQSTPTEAHDGDIYFDKNTRCFLGFDGNAWARLDLGYCTDPLK